MAEQVDRAAACASCGHTMSTSGTSRGLGDLQACPDCGSLDRSFALTFSSTLPLRSGLRLRHRRSGHKRPLLEYVDEPGVQRSTGRPNRVQRTVDRLAGRYRELVTDEETGQLLHHRDDPLLGHRGHGTDRGTRTSPPPLTTTPEATPAGRGWRGRGGPHADQL